jgi:hypothetical protein
MLLKKIEDLKIKDEEWKNIRLKIALLKYF